MNSVHQSPSKGLGIDVSGAELVGATVDVTRQVVCRSTAANEESGCQAMADWIESQGRCFVVFEATGSYHLLLCEVLQSRGIAFRVLNPRMARDLAKGLGILDKSDRVDARVLALAALMLAPEPTTPRSKVHRALRDISREIMAYTEERVAVLKRAATPSRCETAKASGCKLAEFIKRQIQDLEKAWLDLLREAPQLKKRYELVKTVRNIGHKTARVLVSELPEDLEPYTAKQLAAYCGPVPRQRSSGPKDWGARTSKCRNRRLNQGLHMPAQLAVNRDAGFSSLYKRLIAKGHHHLSALTAAKRKLAMHAITVMKRGTPWLDAPPPLASC